jgi:hypothetical protein
VGLLSCDLDRRACAVLFAQHVTPRPVFRDHPAKQIYKGKPAPPLLTKDQRSFRTMIRRGAKSRVEFAGHYTVPRWGCGSSCSQLVIVDSITGKVYDVPFSIVEFPMSYLETLDSENCKRMEFHADSRLMKMDGCPNETNCGYYDYVMIEGKGLELVRKGLVRKKYQPEQ